jgi:3-hydroxyacyl-CoA dehydrogenase/3-hydroxy-2-methylbutyryl-CoA dehydrogenase
MEFNKRVAVVTGGASGLGLATTELLLSQGMKVAVFDLNGGAAEKLVSQHLESLMFCSVNVADEASVQAGFQVVMKVFGAVHILVNCAGICPAGKTLNRQSQALPLSDFSKAIQVNLIGSFNMASLASQYMAKNEADSDGQRGVIINTASVAAFDGQMGQVAYAASKGGVVSLTLPMARDLARYGIRVMTIAPGIFDTPMMQGVSEEYRQPLIATVPNPNRFGAPAEYAKLCVSIISNNYLNGEVIRLDGALRMQAK